MSPEIQEQIDRLEELTSRMDIPPYRRDNVGWLYKHMAIRNSEHENFHTANEILEILYKRGIR